MKRGRILLWFVILIWIVFFTVLLQKAQSQESAEELYEAALFKKEAEGDLEGAIKIFSRIIGEFPENRNIAAKAQLQIGKCYEKLGLKEALQAYQEVIENYPDQKEEVKEAREKISILLRAKAVIERRIEEFRIRQVWAGYDCDTSGAPSLEGRYLSYVDWKTGDLALLEIATGKKRHLTDEASWEEPSEYALNSRISPDSKWVAYSWWNLKSTYDLRLVGIDGTGRRILYSDQGCEVYPADWSSDGKRIAVHRYKWKEKLWETLWISVMDGSIHVLKTPSKSDRVSHSPDDHYIAFDIPIDEDSGNYDIYLLATDGSGEIPLIKHKANDRLLGWAPGRKEVLFLSDRTGTWDVFLIQVEDGKPIGSPRRIKSEIGKISPLGFIQDGSYYYGTYTRWFNTFIAKIDLAKGVLQAPLYQPIVGSNFYPEWSPDGEHLAYITEKIKPRGPGSFNNILHILSLKTGEEREVPCEVKRMMNPRWSPDGRSILVTGIDSRVKEENYQGGLYLIDVENGKVTCVVKYAFGPPHRAGMWGTIRAEWSPDGKTIFYITRESIFRRELESGQETENYHDPNLLFTREYYRPLALSPNGQNLVFCILDPKTNIESLWIMPSSGGEPREFLKLHKADRIRAVAWTPDGDYVLFTKREKKGTSLWRIAPEGGEPQKLWQSEKKLRGLRVHPDGRQIAFYTIKIDTEVWVMENFLPEAK